MNEYSESTIEKFTESVISPLCLFNFYVKRDVDDAFPNDSYPIRIPPESLSEGRYGPSFAIIKLNKTDVCDATFFRCFFDGTQ